MVTRVSTIGNYNTVLANLMTAQQAQLGGYQDQNSLVADRLTTQDTALNQVADATQQARQAIADALASGDASTLMEELQGAMNTATGAMNTRYNGAYLFAGG